MIVCFCDFFLDSKKNLDKNKLIYDFVGSFRRNSQSMGDIDLLIKKTDKFDLKSYVNKLKEDVAEIKMMLQALLEKKNNDN